MSLYVLLTVKVKIFPKRRTMLEKDILIHSLILNMKRRDEFKKRRKNILYYGFK